MGVYIAKSTLKAQIDQIECSFWQISHANMNSRLENGTQNTFWPKKSSVFRVFTFLATLIREGKSDFKEDGQPVGESLGWANVNLSGKSGKRKLA